MPAKRIGHTSRSIVKQALLSPTALTFARHSAVAISSLLGLRLLVYGLSAFIIVPQGLHLPVVKQLQQQAGVNLKIGQVAVDPSFFSGLKVFVSNVDITAQQKPYHLQNIVIHIPYTQLVTLLSKQPLKTFSPQITLNHLQWHHHSLASSISLKTQLLEPTKLLETLQQPVGPQSALLLSNHIQSLTIGAKKLDFNVLNQVLPATQRLPVNGVLKQADIAITQPRHSNSAPYNLKVLIKNNSPITLTANQQQWVLPSGTITLDSENYIRPLEETSQMAFVSHIKQLSLQADRGDITATGDLQLPLPVKQQAYGQLHAKVNQFPLHYFTTALNQPITQPFNGFYSGVVDLTAPAGKTPVALMSGKLHHINLQAPYKNQPELLKGISSDIVLDSSAKTLLLKNIKGRAFDANVKGDVFLYPFSIPQIVQQPQSVRLNTLGWLKADGLQVHLLHQTLQQYAPTIAQYWQLPTYGKINTDITYAQAAASTTHTAELLSVISPLQGRVQTRSKLILNSSSGIAPLVLKTNSTLTFDALNINIHGMVDDRKNITGTIHTSFSPQGNAFALTANSTITNPNMVLAHAQNIFNACPLLFSLPELKQLSINKKAPISLSINYYPSPQHQQLVSGAINTQGLELDFNHQPLLIKSLKAQLKPKQQGHIDAGFALSKLNTDFSAKGVFDNQTQDTIISVNSNDLSPWYKIYADKNTRLKDIGGQLAGKLNLRGKLWQPAISGNILFSQLKGCESYSKSCFKNVAIDSQLDGQSLSTKVTGLLNDTPIKGLFLANQNTLFYHQGNTPHSLTVSEFPLKALWPSIREISHSNQNLAWVRTTSIKSGDLRGTVKINPKTWIPVSGELNATDFATTPITSLGHHSLVIPRIHMDASQRRITSNSIKFGPVELHGVVNYNATGSVASGALATNNPIPLENLLDLASSLNIPLPTIIAPQGELSASGEYVQKGQLITSHLDLNDIGFSADLPRYFASLGLNATAVNFPLEHLTGDIHYSTSLANPTNARISSNGLRLEYANSTLDSMFSLNPNDSSLRNTQFLLTGEMSPLLLNQLAPNLNENSTVDLRLPFELTLTIDAKLHQHYLWKNQFIRTAGIAIDPPAKYESELTIGPNEPIVLTSALSTSGSDWIKINANVDNNTTPFDPPEEHWLLESSPNFNLSSLYNALPIRLLEDLNGNLNSTVVMNGHLGEEQVEGIVKLDKVSSKPLQVKTLSAQADIHPNGTVDWMVPEIKIPGLSAAVSATTPDYHLMPLPLEHFTLTGKSFIVTLFSDWMGNVFRKQLLGHPLVRRWVPDTPNKTLVVEIPDGAIAVDELILNNIIVENYKSTLQLFATGAMDFGQIDAQSAGGKLGGDVTYNPMDNNYMRGHLLFDEMQANAISRALLNVNNQIFGRLSGVINFTTEGDDQTEWLSQANGNANIMIKDGRMPTVAQIENKMILADTLAGGVLNLNLNSLFRSIQQFENDYFATLTGSFQVVNGTLYTDNLKSEGKNFGLLIQGKIRLLDGNANLKVSGTVNKRIKGVLGRFGSLSLGRVFALVPGLESVLSWVPGVGFVPGLGRRNSERGLGFEVDIIGPMDRPDAMQNFRWAKSSSNKAAPVTPTAPQPQPQQ